MTPRSSLLLLTVAGALLMGARAFAPAATHGSALGPGSSRAAFLGGPAGPPVRTPVRFRLHRSGMLGGGGSGGDPLAAAGTGHAEGGGPGGWAGRHRGRLAAGAAALVGAAALGVAFPAASQAAPLLADLGPGTAAATALVDDLSRTGFYQAFSLVFLSEIGDKTFFVAGLLAAKLSRAVSFVGSLGALSVMTVLAVLIGQVFHAVPEGLTQGIPLDDICAVAAFLYFGIKILSEALDMEEGESFMDEELADAEETVDESDTIQKSTAWAQIVSTFGLVFAAEFGDRSFLSCIALSAAQNPVSVAAGSIAAHGIATGIAVLGGAYISKYISERAIGIIGGSLFLVFAATTALGVY